jgi:hypothetical protein
MSLAATVLSTPPLTAPICEVMSKLTDFTGLGANTYNLGLVTNELSDAKNFPC